MKDTESRSKTPLMPPAIKLVLLTVLLIVAYIVGRIPAEQRARQAELAAEQQNAIAVRASRLAEQAAARADEAVQQAQQALLRAEQLAAQSRSLDESTVAGTLERVREHTDRLLSWAIDDQPLPGQSEFEVKTNPRPEDQPPARFPESDFLRSAISENDIKQIYVAWNGDAAGDPWDCFGWKFDLQTRQATAITAEEQLEIADGWKQMHGCQLATIRVTHAGRDAIRVQFHIHLASADMTFDQSDQGLLLREISTRLE